MLKSFQTLMEFDIFPRVIEYDLAIIYKLFEKAVQNEQCLHVKSNALIKNN